MWIKGDPHENEAKPPFSSRYTSIRMKVDLHLFGGISPCI
jgi:hypothetical protein